MFELWSWCLYKECLRPHKCDVAFFCFCVLFYFNFFCFYLLYLIYLFFFAIQKSKFLVRTAPLKCDGAFNSGASGLAIPQNRDMKKNEIQFFSIKDMHCRQVLTFLWSPIEWLTFCQNSWTCYIIFCRKNWLSIFWNPLFSGIAIWFPIRISIMIRKSKLRPCGQKSETEC